MVSGLGLRREAWYECELEKEYEVDRGGLMVPLGASKKRSGAGSGAEKLEWKLKSEYARSRFVAGGSATGCLEVATALGSEAELATGRDSLTDLKGMGGNAFEGGGEDGGNKLYLWAVGLPGWDLPGPTLMGGGLRPCCSKVRLPGPPLRRLTSTSRFFLGTG